MRLLVLVMLAAMAAGGAEKVRFEGKVTAGASYRRPVQQGLVFVLIPERWGGWRIGFVPEREWNPNPLNLSGLSAANALTTGEGKSAEQVVNGSPYRFTFPCGGTKPCKGSLEILRYSITRQADAARIDWIEFAVELRLP